ncbi:MAG: cytochrome P450 [Acidimicrobiales bacterium]
MTQRPEVTDWASDFDHLSDAWAAHSPEILAELRERCPVAHTERFHGAYLVTRYADIADVAHDTATFSSRVTAVNDNHPDNIKLELPPITLDPPEHAPLRRALLPAFNPREVAALEPFVVETVNRLLDDLDGRTEVDGALDYAQLVPVEVMARLFGVSPEMGPQFRRWVDGMLKEGQIDLDIARKANREIQAYFADQLVARRREPADDLVTMVLEAQVQLEDGSTRPFTERERIGALFVLMLGGIDTTWSSLGASLYHLGTHPEDLATLVERPELIPSAVEEFLRFYSPVTIARLITEDAEVAGCPVKAGERVLLAYPSANRDPEVFDRPDEVVLDRAHNRHLSFGVGVHRCLGSNLARMELAVSLGAWVARFPRFELAVDPADITWSVGPVRGPRKVPLRILS